MKRLLIILCIALILPSCAPKADILAYQEGELIAECKINGKYDANIIKKEHSRALELTSNELAGISFIGEDGVWVGEIDGIRIPIEENKLGGIVAITSIFDLSEASITTAQDDGALGVVCFDMDKTYYTVTYNGLSLPERVVIESDSLFLEVEIISITKTDIR